MGPDATRTVQISGATPGAEVGPYRLIRELGEGGMGVVYRAQQTEPIRREVALKIIKPGMDSRQVIARFEGERQALALMDHPNIAHVYDAGTTAAGLPYFAMELVDGVPITRYCDSRQLTMKQRIELLIPVCRAIQHAHQKGIIHRDLKPSNILVAEQEGKAAPKVIDFGLAKALGGQLSDATMMTNLGTVVGTLDYMSPEQADIARQDVDTRSDVYSLGAVLYELLTGGPPLEGATRTSYLEALQRIRSEEAPAPSRRLGKRLDPELDWVTMRALEKDRTRRYETVNGLARDLERYLAGEPVEAAPSSAAYKVSKFVRRHWPWLATAAAFTAVLIAGICISAWMAVRASRAEAAERAVNEFLQSDVLAQASAYNQSGVKPDANLTVRTALDRAAARVEGRFASQPLVEASIRHTIGAAYLDLSLYPDAQKQFERALILRRRELGENHRDTIATMGSLAAIYERSGRLKEAEQLYVKAVELGRRMEGEENPTTLKALNGLAVTYAEESAYAKSEAILSRLVPTEQHVLGEDNFQTLRAMSNLASLYDYLHKYTLAEPLLIKTVAIERRALGEENPETLGAIVNLAAFYTGQAKFDKAEPLYATVVDAYRRVLGETNLQTIAATESMVGLYLYRRDYSKAEALSSRALAAARTTLGEEHPRTLECMAALGSTYSGQKRYAEAEALFTKVADRRMHVLGDDNPETLNALVWSGRTKLERQQYSEAEQVFRKALQVYEKAMPEEWDRFICQGLLGASLAGQRRFDEAEQLLSGAYEGMTRRLEAVAPSDRFELEEMKDRIIRMFESWGKSEKASEWKQKK